METWICDNPLFGSCRQQNTNDDSYTGVRYPSKEACLASSPCGFANDEFESIYTSMLNATDRESLRSTKKDIKQTYTPLPAQRLLEGLLKQTDPDFKSKYGEQIAEAAYDNVNLVKLLRELELPEYSHVVDRLIEGRFDPRTLGTRKTGLTRELIENKAILRALNYPGVPTPNSKAFRAGLFQAAVEELELGQNQDQNLVSVVEWLVSDFSPLEKISLVAVNRNLRNMDFLVGVIVPDDLPEELRTGEFVLAASKSLSAWNAYPFLSKLMEMIHPSEWMDVLRRTNDIYDLFPRGSQLRTLPEGTLDQLVRLLVPRSTPSLLPGLLYIGTYPTDTMFGNDDEAWNYLANLALTSIESLDV